MGQLDTVARKRITAWRKAAGMTQAALAEKIGRNPVWISRYLDEAYDADLDTLKKFAEALGRSLNDLLGPDAPPIEESEVLERFRALALDPNARDLVMKMLRTLTPDVAWPSDAPSRASAPSEQAATKGRSGKRGNRRN